MSSYYDLSEVLEGVSGLHGKHCPMQGKLQKQFACGDRGDGNGATYLATEVAVAQGTTAVTAPALLRERPPRAPGIRSGVT